MTRLSRRWALGLAVLVLSAVGSQAQESPLRAKTMSRAEKLQALHDSLKDVILRGTIVDQEGKPIEGAKIKLYLEKLSGPLSEVWIESGKNGSWEYPLKKVAYATVSDIQKEGYEFVRYPVTSWDLQVLTTVGEPVPVVVRMRLLGRRFFILEQGGEFLELKSPQSTAVSCDLVAGKCLPNPPKGMKDDLRIEAKYKDKGEWEVVYSAVSSEGGIAQSVETLYAAPASGYVGKIAFLGSWEGHLYVKSRDPFIYMRLDVNQDMRRVGEKEFSVRIYYKAFVNPYGSRSLDYDKRLDIRYDIRKRLEMEALADLGRNKLPPIPDLDLLLR